MPKFEQGTCHKCNGSRGRLVVENKGSKKEKHEFWCFECWEAQSLQHVTYIQKKFSSTEESNYNFTVREFYLKTKFYGYEPDLRKIEEAANRLLAKQETERN